MSLRDTEPVPSRILGMVHTAAILAGEEKTSTVDRTELADLMAPSHVNRNTFNIVFSECIQWELLTKGDGNEVCVSMDLIGSLPSIHADRASEQFVHQKLAPFVRSTILQKLRKDIDCDLGFIYMLAWSLLQDGKDYPMTNKRAENLSREQDSNRFIGWTPERYGGFTRWASFLGFQHQHDMAGTAFQPDPTQALLNEFDLWLFSNETEQSVPLPVVLERIETLFPWLEKGAAVQQLRDTLPQLPTREPNALSPAMSLALRRLQNKGLIQLQHLSDANIRILTWAGAQEAITHVQRVKGGA